MRPLPAQARSLSEARFSRLSHRQLIELGCAPVTIHRWVRHGVLTHVGRGQYRVSGAAAHDLETLVAALERCGAHARAGGPWALGLHGVEGFDLTGTRQVAIPRNRRVRGVPFVVVRTAVPEIDQVEVLGIPTVTVERALIDAAYSCTRRSIRVAYYSLKRAGRVDDELLQARAYDLGRVRGAREMRAIIASGVLGLESEGEHRLFSTIFQPGDPLPQAQVRVAWRDRTFRLDYAYLDARLALEYDGERFHAETFDRHADADRDLALAELQIQTLRITSAMMRDPERTRRRILAVRDARLALKLPPIVPLHE